MEVLVPTYGFKGSILIVGACMLHICLSAALYRPIEVHQAIIESQTKFVITYETPTVDCHLLSVPEEDAVITSKTLKVSTTDLSHRSAMFHSVGDLSTDSTVIYKENLSNLKLNTDNGNVVPTESKLSEKPQTKRTKLCSVIDFIDFSLIKDSLFLLVASTVMLMAVGCPQALFYLPSYANSIGLEKSECSLLLSISAVFDLTGRLGLGYIADLNLFSKYKAYSIR